MKPENIIIAEFMARKFTARKDNIQYNKEFKTFLKCQAWIYGQKHPDFIGFTPQLGWDDIGQDYENNWSALMPVIEKIESKGVAVQITLNNCFISWLGCEPEDEQLLKFLQDFNFVDVDGESKIEAVYKGVVAFINDFNSLPAKG